jgi:hypothetical protein
MVMYTSQWLKLYGKKAAIRFWNENFLLDKGRTGRMGLTGPLWTASTNNFRSKPASTVGAKSYRKIVATSYESLIMTKVEEKEALVICNDFPFM